MKIFSIAHGHHIKRKRDPNLRCNLRLIMIVTGILLIFLNCRIIMSNVMTGIKSMVTAAKPDIDITVAIAPESSAATVDAPFQFPLTSDRYTVDPLITYYEYIAGYTTANVNVRELPTTESRILYTYPINTPVYFIPGNEEWYQILLENDVAYIHRNYVREGALTYNSISLTSSGFKSFMSYKAITCKSSRQYKIQNEYAYTGKYGIRQVDGRFCVALGSAANASIGTYIDLVLENGTIIPCVLSDHKDDKHTRDDNLTTDVNGCVSEFIVDTNSINSDTRAMGDISFVNSKWASPVVEIRVYSSGIWN